MGNERIPTMMYDDVASTSSTIARINEGSRKRKAPSSPIPDDNSHSPLVLVVADDKDDEGREDEEEEKENGGDEIDEEEGNDEEENGIASAWPKSDDCELFKRMRKACPKDDAMKYELRVNHLNWESIKFQDYSAEVCKNRWLHVQTHLRNYRILAEVLEDAESWVDGPCYNNLNKRRTNNQKHPDVQPKKPRTSYMLPSMEQKDVVLEKSFEEKRLNFYHQKNELAATTQKSPALAASNQLLFKAKKMTEPPKPPASATAYYVMTQHSQLGELDPAVMNFLWGMVSEKEKKKCIEEHKKIYEDFVLEFLKFIGSLNPDEFRSYCIVMDNRARDQECGDKNSKSTSASLKSSEGSSDSPPKKPASNVDSESVKSPSKITPSLNDNVKSSSTVKVASTTLISSTVAASQSLFKAEKMTEPIKPPASAAAYYVITHQSKLGELSPDEIDVVWIRLSVEQRKEYIEEHSKKYEDYILDLYKFAGLLNPAELRSYRIFMKNRARDQDGGDKESKSTSASLKSPEGSSPKTLASSTLAASSQLLFKAGKMTEPLKPPTSAAAYYVMTQQSQLGELTPDEIYVVWVMLSVEQRKKCIEEHSKKYEEYVLDMVKFAQTLNPAELRSFRIFMKNRARGLEDGDKNSQCTSASLKSSEGSSDSPPKKPASSADSKSAKSPSKIQPSVNANVKSSTEKEVASQSVFKAGKMTEPLKPPASAAGYYVMTHHSKLGNLTPPEIDALWGMVPEKEKKKCIEEHKKRHKDFVRNFEIFIRTLNPDELRSYRDIMKIRARDEEEEVNESSDEESSDEERNDEERML